MIVIVGVAPGRGGTIRHLSRLLSVSPEVVTTSVAWVNLWPHGQTGSNPEHYVALVEQGTLPGDLIVLLGREVVDAFGLADLHPLETVVRNAGAGPTLLAFPHPSGLNRWWNDPVNASSAQATLETLWRRSL